MSQHARQHVVVPSCKLSYLILIHPYGDGAMGLVLGLWGFILKSYAPELSKYMTIKDVAAYLRVSWMG
ncbi:MAG: hypothetical protein LWX01_07975 [Deltaproteobacteria bacterium]|nr:hypothetical protein [Deltaproteobacteria bacterium]MDL1961621.1 hypothetical protein [Deltaproteobacteria bacterium]